MNPKTFQIRLYQPFGWMTHLPYIFYLHAETREDAFAWVARVFQGIDLRQPPPTSFPRVGNTTPVSVTDCDRYRKHGRLKGRFVALETPEGHFRQPASEIVSGLHKIHSNLQSERQSFVRSFETLKSSYERDGQDWVYERLVLVQQFHARAVLWEAAVWEEYLKIAPKDELVLPEKRMPAVLKHIVMTARERTASVS